MNTSYNFSTDWFLKRKSVFEKCLYLSGIKKDKKLNYLEIGVYEGQSLIWMLDNVLTHRESTAYAIDPFINKEVYKRFQLNLEKSNKKHKSKIDKRKSQVALRELNDDFFDIIYVDGSHVAKDVLIDLIESFRILKNKGLLIIDDYMLGKGQFPQELRPELSVNAFLTAYRSDLELLYIDKKSENVKDHRNIIPQPIIVQKSNNTFTDFNHEFVHPGNIYNLITKLDNKKYYNWDTGVIYEGENNIRLDGGEREKLEEELLDITF